jgi:hypothetical protein
VSRLGENLTTDISARRYRVQESRSVTDSDLPSNSLNNQSNHSLFIGRPSSSLNLHKTERYYRKFSLQHHIQKTSGTKSPLSRRKSNRNVKPFRHLNLVLMNSSLYTPYPYSWSGAYLIFKPNCSTNQTVHHIAVGDST